MCRGIMLFLQCCGQGKVLRETMEEKVLPERVRVCLPLSLPLAPQHRNYVRTSNKMEGYFLPFFPVKSAGTTSETRSFPRVEMSSKAKNQNGEVTGQWREGQQVSVVGLPSVLALFLLPGTCLSLALLFGSFYFSHDSTL